MSHTARTIDLGPRCKRLWPATTATTKARPHLGLEPLGQGGHITLQVIWHSIALDRLEQCLGQPLNDAWALPFDVHCLHRMRVASVKICVCRVGGYSAVMTQMWLPISMHELASA